MEQETWIGSQELLQIVFHQRFLWKNTGKIRRKIMKTQGSFLVNVSSVIVVENLSLLEISCCWFFYEGTFENAVL